MVNLFRGIVAFIMANPYILIRWEVLEKGFCLVKQEGSEIGKFTQVLLDVTKKDEDPSLQIALFLLDKPIELAVAVLDILIKVDRAIFDATREVIIKAAEKGNQKAIELLATYLIVCVQDPNIVYSFPEQLSGNLIQVFKEKYNINMIGVRLPLILLQTAFYLIMLFPFVGLYLIITNSQFFLQTNAGVLLFFGMFVLSFWLQRAGKLIQGLIFRKKQEE